MLNGRVATENAERQPRYRRIDRERRKRAGSLDAAFATVSWPVRFNRGTAVFSENQPAEHVYLVVSGAVRTVRVLCDGRRQVCSFHLPGDIFALEADRVHRFTTEALAPSTIRFAKRHALTAMAADDPDLGFDIAARLSSELRRANEHVLLLGQKTAEERIMSFLLDMSTRVLSDEIVELPMSRQDVADYLGLAIETVSRNLTQLEAKGAIELLGSRRIVLTSRHHSKPMSREAT